MLDEKKGFDAFESMLDEVLDEADAEEAATADVEAELPPAAGITPENELPPTSGTTPAQCAAHRAAGSSR